jgi:hypothetical protein
MYAAFILKLLFIIKLTLRYFHITLGLTLLQDITECPYAPNKIPHRCQTILDRALLEHIDPSNLSGGIYFLRVLPPGLTESSALVFASATRDETRVLAAEKLFVTFHENPLHNIDLISAALISL